jgi:hypothetical protein
MVTLLVMIVFVMVVGRLAGAALCPGPRSAAHRRRMERRGDVSGDLRGALDELRGGLSDAGEASPRPVVSETPLEKLQHEFARGDISIEQYERELNRLYGIRG